MTSKELRQAFLNFFEKNGHKIVPSSSLLPDDPSVLLTTAGMQQFKKYYMGEADAQKDFGTKNTASVQKSFRTSDIDEVGDESHDTFFEMLGNFSFGGYFKKEAIEYAYDFFKEINLPIEYVTVFGGDSEVSSDNESEKIWKDLGITKIEKRGREDNFWGPTGNEGPCGPTTEIYVRGVEIWNIVFNEYYCKPDKTMEKLKQNGVDTGMGLERLAMVAQGKKNIFETDLFAPLIQALPTAWEDEKINRIIADHARAIAFLISDGVRPSNKDAGYILRRILRRVIVHIHLKQGTSLAGLDTLPMGIETDLKNVLDAVLKVYKPVYPELDKDTIFNVFDEERRRFGSAFKNGLREIKKLDKIDGQTAFRIYESYGLPFELIKEFGGEKTDNLTRAVFDEEFKKHQEISRAGAVAKFGGHGIYLKTGEVTVKDKSELEKVTRLHTATHLLHAALRAVLGPEVQQDGSDITVERTRFDFTFSRKLTPEEVKKVEDLVNKKIKEDLVVSFVELPIEEAKKTGALWFFKEKYPPKVKVYSMGDFSKEFCGGPHVKRTSEAGIFKITKEEAVGAGVRRIRAVVL